MRCEGRPQTLMAQWATTRLQPSAPERPREYIRPLFVTDEYVEMILEGLEKAGLEVSDKTP